MANAGHEGNEAAESRGLGMLGAILAAGALVACAALALMGIARVSARREPPPPDPVAYVTAREPRGDVEAAPRLFAWNAVEGAVQYKVTIADADAFWPLFVKQTSETSLVLEDRETLAIVPGRIHVWEVEALDGGGRALAKGGVRFRVAPAEPLPAQ